MYGRERAGAREKGRGASRLPRDLRRRQGYDPRGPHRPADDDHLFEDIRDETPDHYEPKRGRTRRPGSIEYEALVAATSARDEEADDVAVYDRRKAKLAAGLDARLPPEVSAQLLKGESMLKSLRNWRDVTQMHLAFKTGLE